MAVVSDTSPLRYFIATGHVDLLKQVLGPLIIPGVVLSELTHSSAPEPVRKWCSALPNWVSVIDPRQPPDAALVRSMDPGEAAAIQLAGELKADILLIDERTGRAEATRQGIPVVGGLGVLQAAFRRGLVSDPMAIVLTMRRGGFRVSKRLLDEFQDGIESIRQTKDTPS